MDLLPDAAKILVNHLLSLVAAKGLLELWHVGNHVVDAVLGIGMRIGQNQSANQLRPVLITPSKRIRQEESLQIRKTVGTLIAETFALPGQSAFERQKSQMESATFRARRMPWSPTPSTNRAGSPSHRTSVPGRRTRG